MRTSRKHKPNLFWFFCCLFVFTTTYQIHSVYMCMTHSCMFLHGEEYTRQNEREMRGRVGYLPPEGCWNLEKTGLCKLRSEHGLGAPKQQAPGRDASVILLSCTPSFQLAFLTTPVTTLRFVYFHKELGLMIRNKQALVFLRDFRKLYTCKCFP